MLTLQRLLADRVIEALEAREHVLVVPGANEALRGEVENVIAPTLPTIAPYLMQVSADLNDDSPSFGDDDANDVVASMVDQIAEQLMASDHVDDIFAEDRLIRRDAFRAIRDILLRYIQGDLELTDDNDDHEAKTLSLTDLGYVARVVSQQADPLILHDSLARSARAAGAQLASYDSETGAATFHMRDGTLLELEEAIAEEMVHLVQDEAVEFPGVQQVLEVPEAMIEHPGFADALASATAKMSQRTSCIAGCTLVDERALLASITPLSDDDAERAHEHFDAYLAEIEDALETLEAPDSAERVAAEPPDVAPTPPASRRRQRHGSTKKKRKRAKR